MGQLIGVPEDKAPEVPTEGPKQITSEQVPTPTGYHILVAIEEVKDTFDGTSILKDEKFKQHEEISSVIARVVDMGPDAYGDKARFPNGPWCEVGDYVLIRAYSGTRFRIFGKEIFRIINDDSVEAVVKDPTGYSRI